MLVVEKLVKLYQVGGGLSRRRWLHAADGVDLTIREGETLGLVGESGSGKSTVGRCVLRLEEPTSGRISLGNTSVTDASGEELRRLRSRMQMVYQDPLDSLNPRMSIGAQVAEPIWLTGWAAGKHKIILTLVDKDGKIVDNGGFNATVREITITK